VPTPPPYEFTWGTSAWGDGSVWAEPGTYGTSGDSEAVTADGSAMPEVTVNVSGDASGAAGGVTDAEAGSGLALYVEPDNSGVFVTATTARVYMRLPAMYRDGDAGIEPDVVLGYDVGLDYDEGDGGYDEGVPNPNNRPLLRWLASLIDPSAGVIEAIIDRIDSPTSSALTDPQTCNIEWLPWLGQLVGVRVPFPVADESAARAQVQGALTSAPAGSRPAIIQTVQTILTGTKSVTITDHYTGDPWKIQVNTLAVETPTVLTGSPFTWGVSLWGGTDVWEPPDPVVALLVLTGQKPAGFTIIHTTS
jgi:hypothetical protein